VGIAGYIMLNLTIVLHGHLGRERQHMTWPRSMLLDSVRPYAVVFEH